MKTRLLIIFVIAAVVVSSTITYMIVPVKYVGSSLNSPWLQENLDASKIIRESDIPILGVDVDRKVGILTIYMTDENSKKYVQKIDELLDVPFDILSETQSRELRCLQTYKDIREISRTHGAATAEWHIIRHQMHAVDEYVELKCPDFSDLNSMKDKLKKYAYVSIPQGAAFMTGFNQLYYSFSPTIADMERENPIFQETVRAFITPMMSSLSIMALAEDGNEAQVLGLGVSIIALNLGLYFVAPTAAGITISKLLKSKN